MFDIPSTDDTLMEIGVVLTCIGAFILFVIVVVISTSNVDHSRMLFEIIASASFVLLTVGLSLVFYSSGKDKGYELGLKDGKKGLIASSLVDEITINDAESLSAGKYKLLKSFESGNNAYYGLLLNIESSGFLKVLYYRKDYPLSRFKEGQEFTVNAEGEFIIEVADALIEGDKAFVKV